MSTVEYLFGIILGELLLEHIDNASKALQNPKLSSSEGQHLAELTLKTLSSIRTDDSFCQVISTQNTLEVNDPIKEAKGSC